MKTRLIALAAAAALATGFITGCTTTSKPPEATSAEKRAKINSEVDAALAKLYAQDPAARELVAKARGVLVFPDVKSAGFIVGGSYGEGALRAPPPGTTAGYYKTVAGSVGLLAGAESKALYLLFMNQAALDKFRSSNGWTAGADASVTMMKTGASAGIDTATAQQSIIGYALSQGGLMANLSVDGTKVSPIEP